MRAHSPHPSTSTHLQHAPAAAQHSTLTTNCCCCGVRACARACSGIVGISDQAFRGCSSLATIDIPDTVTSIGDASFQLCTKLSSLSIPSTAAVGEGAFSNTSCCQGDDAAGQAGCDFGPGARVCNCKDCSSDTSKDFLETAGAAALGIIFLVLVMVVGVCLYRQGAKEIREGTYNQMGTGDAYAGGTELESNA